MQEQNGGNAQADDVDSDFEMMLDEDLSKRFATYIKTEPAAAPTTPTTAMPAVVAKATPGAPITSMPSTAASDVKTEFHPEPPAEGAARVSADGPVAEEEGFGEYCGASLLISI